MTTLLQTLQSADAPSRELDVAVLNAVGKSARMWTSTAINPFGRMGLPRPDAVQGHGNLMKPVPKLTSSLDAALDLVAERLPTAGFKIETIKRSDDTHMGWSVSFSANYRTPHIDEVHKHPAIALLIALLRALEAEAQDG